MSVIELQSISKKYKNLQAVKDLSFSVNRGEIFGLLGPNGAGKTTTIKILTTQLKPDTGTALVLGFDTVSQGEKIKEKIGIVFEEQNFYPRLSVLQNLEFFASLYGKGRKEVLKALEYVDLSNRKNDEAQKLSRGLKQRLLIARALLPDPEIIFLDEPTSGLDPHVARDIRNIFKNLKNEGKSILLTTHYMEEADELCDRVAFINKGSIVKVDTPDNFKEHLGSSTLTVTIEAEQNNSQKIRTFPSGSTEAVEYLTKLTAEKLPFRIKSTGPSLEDVFIAMTGTNLADEGNKN
jgi:ABC-2 type transport system ATP-binding protein